MSMTKSKISIIVAFFKGNQYLERLMKSITRTAVVCREANIEIEVIFVNDSPLVDINLPQGITVETKIIVNSHNIGIHASRLNGLKNSDGEWVIFLDQDDELVADGFKNQLILMNNVDVVVGNGLYQYGEKKCPIFKNYKAMHYLIKGERFIQIRNSIPSPGECLIRKCAIPACWRKFILNSNGSDDWMLWLLLFHENRVFVCNERYVYIHNDTAGNNLSLDLEKMYKSSLEMCDILRMYGNFSNNDLGTLRRAIDFKFYQDSKKLTVGKILRYINVIFANIKYKIKLSMT